MGIQNHHPLHGQMGNSGDFDVEDIVDDGNHEGSGDYADEYEVGGDFGSLGNSYEDDEDDNGMGFSFSKSLQMKIAASKAAAAKKAADAKAAAQVKATAAAQAAANAITQRDMSVITGQASSNSMTFQPSDAGASERMTQNSSYDPAGAVVSTGGQLSEQKLQTAPTVVAKSSVAYAHPLLSFSMAGAMGDDGMGFSFSSLLSDAKAKAAEELKKLQAKAAADLKARAGTALSNVSSSILSKPSVQAAIADQAKAGAVSSIAEKLSDPATQKKILIGGGIAAAVVALLAAKAFKK